MFSNEVAVKGNYVSGTIKENGGSKDSSRHSYMLYSELNFGGRGGTTWTADELRKIAEEILATAQEIDKHNKTDEMIATVYLDSDVWKFESKEVSL